MMNKSSSTSPDPVMAQPDLTAPQPDLSAGSYDNSSESNISNKVEPWPSWPLLAFGAVLGFYLYLSNNSSKQDFHPVAFNLKLLLVIIPLLLLFLVRYLANQSPGSYVLRIPHPQVDSFYPAAGSTWGVALILILLLLLISYHSS